MPNNGSRRGATNLGTPLMIVAFVVIAGFMWWLSQQAAAERALQEAQAAEAAAAEDTATTVQLVPVEDIQMDATPFVGEEIRIRGVNVASLLGEQGFWLETPSGNPFLVSMGPEVQAAGTAVQPGSAVTVVGTIQTMDASVLDAWTEAGTIAEGDRIVAEFATHYLQASDVLVSGASPQQRDTTGASGQGSGSGNEEGGSGS